MNAVKSNARITENAEDYLERIQEMIDSKGYARVSDLAEELHLSKPGVSNMIQRLAKQGLIQSERYRCFTLTEAGRRVAKDIQNRHRILTEFFNLLGVRKNVAAHDIEGIEHHLSPETLRKLKLHLMSLQGKVPRTQFS